MNTIEHSETNEPIETYEKTLADLNSRVSTATRALLKSGIALLEAQVRELGRTIETKDSQPADRQP
jgi:hypothetical protein